MRVEKLADRIRVYEPTDFNVVQTLDCGQIFRFKINGREADVYSVDKHAHMITYDDHIDILTKDLNYFYDFFDFDRDYSIIKSKLKNDKFLHPAVEYGYGIRILNNDAFEMIVSFIISANNNISRIKNSVEYLCLHFGKNMGEYYAFPTLNSLKAATVDDYRKAGLGYRAEQMFDTIQRLTEEDVKNITNMNESDMLNHLVKYKGIGEKVANCIMLFGMRVKSVFPVDTWINKVYNQLTKTNSTNRKMITRELTNRYKELSGYAQQYFYYYYRDNKIS